MLGRSILKVHMIGSSVQIPDEQFTRSVPDLGLAIDPLSEVLTLVKPVVHTTSRFRLPHDKTLDFPPIPGMKCYAVLSGTCWLTVDGDSEPVQVRSGDCCLLSSGRPFQLTIDRSLPLVDARTIWERHKQSEEVPTNEDQCLLAGGHFLLSEGPSEMILRSLPRLIHIREETDRGSMRLSIEQLRSEFRHPQPGAALLARYLASALLLQALRLYLTNGSKQESGWLFALSDRRMGLAIQCMHNEPGHAWTLETLARKVGISRSGFASHFREKVGVTPMEYLTRWRMFLAGERLRNSPEGLASISQSLGYESESAFGKAFRRVMGCSPRQYRDQAIPTTASETRVRYAGIAEQASLGPVSP